MSGISTRHKWCLEQWRSWACCGLTMSRGVFYGYTTSLSKMINFRAMGVGKHIFITIIRIHPPDVDITTQGLFCMRFSMNSSHAFKFEADIFNLLPPLIDKQFIFLNIKTHIQC